MLPSNSYTACRLITGSAALLVSDAASALLTLQEEARVAEQRQVVTGSIWIAGSVCLQEHCVQSLSSRGATLLEQQPCWSSFATSIGAGNARKPTSRLQFDSIHESEVCCYLIMGIWALLTCELGQQCCWSSIACVLLSAGGPPSILCSNDTCSLIWNSNAQSAAIQCCSCGMAKAAPQWAKRLQDTA